MTPVFLVKLSLALGCALVVHLAAWRMLVKPAPALSVLPEAKA